MKKEKIPLMIIYKHDDSLYCETTKDMDNFFELYGFLSMIIKDLERLLQDDKGKIEQ